MNKKMIVFLGIETILYVGLLGVDITDRWSVISTPMKFMSILLCFCYAPSLALFFTVLADACLLLIRNNGLGILCFILVQWIYWNQLATKKKVRDYGTRIILFVLILGIAVWVKLPLDFVAILAIFYFINIVGNVVLAVKRSMETKKKSTKYILLAVGMVLFLCCDINVGIYNISNYFSLESYCIGYVQEVSKNLIWLFYLPSQILIAFYLQN